MSQNTCPRNPVANDVLHGHHNSVPGDCEASPAGAMPLRHALENASENPLTLLKSAGNEKIRRLRRVLHASATVAKLFPMPLSTLGGWHPEAYRAMGTIAVNIASKTLSSLHYALATFFQRHVALLASKNAVCHPMSGFNIEV